MKPNKRRLDTLNKLIQDTTAERLKVTKSALFYGNETKSRNINSEQVSMPMNRRQRRANKK